MKLFSELWTNQTHGESDPQPESNQLLHFPGSADRSPPSYTAAVSAVTKIDTVLHPPKTTGHGHKPANINHTLKSRLTDMQSILHLFIRHRKWMEDSEQVAFTRGRGPYYGRRLRSWIKSFIADAGILPTDAWGTSKLSRLDTEPELRQDLEEHLHGIGKYVRAQDIVDYLDLPQVKEKYGASAPISLTTAQRWMQTLRYRWGNTPTGCYVDGHERQDVVNYRQDVFLPAWFAKEPNLRVWTDKNITDPVDPFDTGREVIWYHDESVCYAHDRRERRWVPYNETAVPRPKGEGASLMVADFVSADYGWLKSPDGIESARVLLRPGARRNGYFTHDDVITQASKVSPCCQPFTNNNQTMSRRPLT